MILKDPHHHIVCGRFTALETRLIAGPRDLAARKEMKRRGYRLDNRKGVRKPVPTRNEVRQEHLENYSEVKLGPPVNGYSHKPNYVTVWVPTDEYKRQAN